MRNFTLKVFPVPPGQPNRRPLNPEKAPEKESRQVKEEAISPNKPKEGTNIIPQEPCLPGKAPGEGPPCPSPLPSPEPPPPPFAAPPFIPFPPQPFNYQGPPAFPQFPQYQMPGFQCPAEMRIAHSYVPWQYYNVVFSPAEALDKGTLFPELFQPQGVYGPCEGPQPCHTYFPGGGGPYGCY